MKKEAFNQQIAEELKRQIEILVTYDSSLDIKTDIFFWAWFLVSLFQRVLYSDMASCQPAGSTIESLCRWFRAISLLVPVIKKVAPLKCPPDATSCRILFRTCQNAEYSSPPSPKSLWSSNKRSWSISSLWPSSRSSSFCLKQTTALSPCGVFS